MKHYTYTVECSPDDPDDKKWVATVAEYPSLSFQAYTPGEAVAGLEATLRYSVKDNAADE